MMGGANHGGYVNAVEVLETKAYLSRIREWLAIPADANPTRWLERFDTEHREHAVALLDSFIFISNRQIRKMFISAIHSLSGEVSASELSYAAKKAVWNHFLEKMLVSCPTGEDPNPTDSGHIFLRLARTELRIDEARVVNSADLKSALSSAGKVPLIMVDDFAGSGNQFLETWFRLVWTGRTESLKDLASLCGTDVYYVPLVATSYAIDRLSLMAPEVKVRPCHILAENYSASHPDSVVFPDTLRLGSADFIRTASDRASLNYCVRGFHDLELAIAFEHSIPDACLALLWSEESGWFPLMARR